jgi:hypothetical protein
MTDISRGSPPDFPESSLEFFSARSKMQSLRLPTPKSWTHTSKCSYASLATMPSRHYSGEQECSVHIHQILILVSSCNGLHQLYWVRFIWTRDQRKIDKIMAAMHVEMSKHILGTVRH